MDAFSACLALGPLAIYLVLLGTINLARHPLVTSGTRETLALALAVAGMAIVGPMQLFMPQDAAARFGWVVWILLVVFYALCVTMVLMISRPRLVIYNVARETLEPILIESAKRLDHESTWAGSSLVMPQMRVQLHVDCYEPLNNVSLVATSGEQSTSGWRRLEAALCESLANAPGARSVRGAWLLLAGVALLSLLAMMAVDNPDTIARGLDRLLHP